MTLSATERARARHAAQTMYAGFYRCPTTGRVIEALHGDDKAICGCGHSNPALPAENTERTGTHVVRFLTPATVDDYIDQQQSDGILNTLKPHEPDNR